MIGTQVFVETGADLVPLLGYLLLDQQVARERGVA